VASARARLALGQARLEQLAQDLARQEAMHQRDLASQETVERMRTDHRVQKASVEADQQEVERMVAALKNARDDLSKTVYRAPVSGVVARLNVEAGETVITGTMNNPGSVILTVADLAAMEVEAEVDETDVVNVAPGQKARITVDAIPDTSFEGTVVSVGNSGRQAGQGADQVVNFEVKVRFNAADSRIKPGMTADVDVETRTVRDVLTVPIQCLVARNRGRVDRERRLAAGEKDTKGKAQADTVDAEDREKRDKEILEGVYAVKDGKAVFVPVTSGLADETRIEIRGELAEGDVVASGPFKVLRELKEGTRIKSGKKGSGEGKDKDKE
jgi:HlyD family secretion protein